MNQHTIAPTKFIQSLNSLRLLIDELVFMHDHSIHQTLYYRLRNVSDRFLGLFDEARRMSYVSIGAIALIQIHIKNAHDTMLRDEYENTDDSMRRVANIVHDEIKVIQMMNKRLLNTVALVENIGLFYRLPIEIRMHISNILGNYLTQN